MDTYSNLLYVKEMKVELAYLAHRATEIDKYRLETCCIVGKFITFHSKTRKNLLFYCLINQSIFFQEIIIV